jgi:hypothetical protein
VGPVSSDLIGRAIVGGKTGSGLHVGVDDGMREADCESSVIVPAMGSGRGVAYRGRE